MDTATKLLRRLWERIKDEPVLGWQVVAAVISLAGSFGFELSAEQTSGLFVVFQALAAFGGRQLVTPKRRITPRPQPAQLDPRLFGKRKES